MGFEYAYAGFAIGCVLFAAALGILRWIIGAICRAEIRRFFKGHLISRRGRNGRFVGLR